MLENLSPPIYSSIFLTSTYPIHGWNLFQPSGATSGAKPTFTVTFTPTAPHRKNPALHCNMTNNCSIEMM